MQVIWRPRDKKILNAEKILPPLIQDFLSARGFAAPDEVEKWLNPKLTELRDPFMLKGMREAVERILKAYQAQEKIAIYADFDLDGTSGLALALSGFKALGFQNVIYYQPKRLSEGYGIHVKAIEELKAEGVSLIITVDVGITALEPAKKCRELGVDLIITDHHLPGKELPEAFCIVNPNSGLCSSGLGHLCGAGVAFYLVWALKRAMVEVGLVLDGVLDLRELLDCFVIGTLTDMVPMLAENRVLAKHGLVRLSETKRPGLKVLLDELGLSGRPLSSQDVAIRFAPKLNALSRMELGIFPIELFIMDDHERAKSLVSQVLKQNDLRVSLQGEAEQLALKKLEGWPFEDFVFVSDTSFHRGVVGLIATRLAQIYQKPVFVGSQGEDGQIVGSARCYGGSWNLVQALESAKSILRRFGGHAQAAGFELSMNDQDQFVECLNQFFIEAKTESFSRAVEVLYDLELGVKDISVSLMRWIDSLGPYGSSFETPIFLLRNLQVRSVKNLKGGHFRLKVQDLSGEDTVDAMLFSPSPEQQEVCTGKMGALLDLLVEPQWNYYMGKKTVQLLIKDIRLSQLNG